MIPMRFDHFITYAETPSIDAYLEEYRAAGFITAERTVRHEPGLRNGFIMIGPEYIEFCWVEDEDLFAASDTGEGEFRAAVRPWGLGLVTDDVRQVHDDWAARGYVVAPVASKGPRDGEPDAAPVWSFQELPEGELPGVLGFALTYHTGTRAQTQVQVRIAPNTVYAIEGVTFVAADPPGRARRWRDLLDPAAAVETDENGASVVIGPHRVNWITPGAYEAIYGMPWTPAAHTPGDLAVMHLLAGDRAAAQRMLAHAGRRVVAMSGPGGAGHGLFVPPDPRDGFAFAIRERVPDDWLRERTARTGEHLVLVPD